MSVELRIALAGLVGLILAGSVLPISYTASPEWDVWVVDEQGKPLPGRTVRLNYQNYSAELLDHTVDATTDARGHVRFPLQRQRATLLGCIYHSTVAASAGIHASFGRHAFVFTFGSDGLEGTATANGSVFAWTGGADRIESRIVAKRLSVSR